MAQNEGGFDVIVVGAGSAGAVIAARLSEDPSLKVCLLEAGGAPPPAELMPAAVASLQNNPETDWMYEGDAGGVGHGLTKPGRMMVPRGKMLGGSSGINYMAYVRGHPGDFDAWEKAGATGWSYADVLPYFKKSEGLTPSEDVVIDKEAHSTDGPLGVSVRSPVLTGAAQFVEAASAAGIPKGDYNGRDRGGAAGFSSLFQTTTRDGKRSSTFHAFLEPNMAARDNLTVVTHATAERLVLEGEDGDLRATGVTYRAADGTLETVHAAKEVIVSAGAVGSPHLLMLSGIGPADDLKAVGIDCAVDLPVGRHLKDHLHTGLYFQAPGVGETMAEIAVSLGPDALRAPAGPLPADPADDANLPPELAAVKAEAERRLMEWATTGKGIPSSSLYDAVAFFNTGLGDEHTHDAQIGFLTCGYTPDIWEHVFRVRSGDYFANAAEQLDPTKGVVVLLPNPVQPHSEGSITLTSADPSVHPKIDFNYLSDPHDVKVFLAVMRKGLDIAKSWPGDGLGELMVPPGLADKHQYDPAVGPSDALLEDMARHYSLTVYHLASTCRIGDVVEPTLKVKGVRGLRVADASVMPNIVSGNTNAACIMIGEKAAELVAEDHGVQLQQLVRRTG